MPLSMIQLSLVVLAASGLGVTSQIKLNPGNKAKAEPEGFTTHSAVWIEYQRERFGVTNNQAKPQIVSPSQSTHIAVPANTTGQPMDVVTPKVETTSRRHSSQATEGEVADGMAASTDATQINEGDIQFPTMQGFLKFLKSMQNTWIKKSALSIEKKIKLLKQLRDNLMKIIEQQFSVLWQPTERQRRKRRGLLEDANIDFPPEAAIMSINFLTFAVFLIKLVLQVVQIVKSKHYNFSGFNINTEVVRNP
ncbi:uncharacterized protein Dwil_GK11502 [Drosophila willistoni]|uniref:Uncharacterized protein n=2 Tax=Drosophila willistoni TaxID=7260 RepID=B4N9C7_DROWI|nr:uncharacterized protein Dwil_GK11502 [Drosophila willistoni]